MGSRFIREVVAASHGGIHTTESIYFNNILPRLTHESEQEIDSGTQHFYEVTK